MRKFIPVALLLILAGEFSDAEAKGEASFMVGKTFVDELRSRQDGSFGGTIGVFSRIVGFELGFDFMPTSDFEVLGGLGASVLNVAGNVVLQRARRVLPLWNPRLRRPLRERERRPSRRTSSSDVRSLQLRLRAEDVLPREREFASTTVASRSKRAWTTPALNIPIVGEEINAEPDISRFFVG
jgi:hypothetical protein